MSVAGAVVELEHAVERHAIPGKIHHRQVTGGNGWVLQHLLKDNARNAAGQVHEILILGHLLGKSGIGQKAAVLDFIADEGFFDHRRKIFEQVGVQVHGAVGKQRFRGTGVQKMEDDLIDLDFHDGQCSFGIKLRKI